MSVTVWSTGAECPGDAPWEDTLKKMFRAATAGWMVLAGISAASALDSDGNDGGLSTKPCFISGLKERVECVTLDVPLDYAAQGGDTIPLHAAIIRAGSSNNAPDPLWVFAGGPGQAASEYGRLVYSAFKSIRHTRDIVLVDQRGTGRSEPLDCDVDPEGPVLTTMDEWTAFIKQCRSGIAVDVRQFTMEHVVRDMDAMRAALGYDQLNLWGGSWGTRTAALYLRRYPQHVRSVIMDGVAPPDLSLFESAPASAQRALDLLVADCAASDACAARYPDFEAQVMAFVASAKDGKLRFKGPDPLTGKPTDFPISFILAVESIRSAMYSSDASIMIPMMVEAAVQGNMAPLAALMGGNAAADSMYIGATLSILCGEEIPRTRPAELARAAETSFAEESYFAYWQAGCDGWQALPQAPDAHDPIASDVPTLILSGNLDPVTPPGMGEHLLRTFPNGRHIVVSGNGHITSATACMPYLMRAFLESLDTNAVDASCLGHLARLPIITGMNGTVN